MEELDFNDEVRISKPSRSGYGAEMNTPQRHRTRKPNKFREIERLLEERRLQKELQEFSQ